MAVRSPRFLYIHPCKTGGMKVTTVMLGEVPGAHIVESPNYIHLPRSECGSAGGRTVFSTVRDPWRWYASWYLHVLDGAEGGGRELNWSILRSYGRGSTRFEDVLFGLTHPEVVEPMDNLGGFWPNASRSDWDRWKASGMGFCSFLYTFMWEGGVDVLVATDRLLEGLDVVLGQRVRDRSSVNDRAHKVAHQVGDYAEMFGAPGIRWVAESDRAIVQRFGFKPFSPSLQAVYAE